LTGDRTYQAYGLTIRVPFACPSLAPASTRGAACVPDVVVRAGRVPRRLSAPLAHAGAWEAAPGMFLLRGGTRAGRFLAESGTVTFERNPGCDDAVLARLFTQYVLAALLRQRGLLVLHANAVTAPGGAIVIGGESGAGKSTTTAALLGAGCRMLSDDITVLRAGRAADGAAGTVDVLPGLAEVHLTGGTAASLGYRVAPGQVQPWRRMKAAIPTRDDMARRPGRLLALYVLRPSDADDVTVTEVSGGDKFRALQECVYGPMFAEEHPDLFPLMTAVAGLPFHFVDRPSGRWSVSEVIRGVLARSRGGGPVSGLASESAGTARPLMRTPSASEGSPISSR
jgi:hypothetical protein